MSVREIGLRLAIEGAKEVAKELAGVQDEVAEIGDVAQDTGTRTQKAMRALSGLGNAVRSGAATGGRALLGLGKVAGRAAAIGGAALGSLAAAGFAVGVKIAAGTEQANISFTTMLGSATAARDFLGQLQAFAARTPFGFGDLQTAASSLISVGINADSVIPIMTSLGNATSGMGTGAEGVKRATVALQQMNAAGKITGEDLNQLRDAGVPVYDLLAAATGKSVEAVAELAQKGKLGREELTQLMSALESGAGLERFAGLMDKQSASLTGRWSTFIDTVQMGLGRIAMPWLPTLGTGLGAVSAVAERFLAGATSRSEAFAARAPAAIAAFTGGLDLASIKAAALGVEAGSLTGKSIPLNAIMTKVGSGVRAVALAAIALVIAFQDGQTGAAGLAGKAQVLGVWLASARDTAFEFAAGLRASGGASSGAAGGAEAMGAAVRTIASAIAGADVSGFMSSISAQAPTFTSGLQVAGVVTNFLAGHLGTLARWMPLIAAGFLLMKASQVASSIALTASIPLRYAEVAATLQHSAALRANTAATTGGTVAQNVGIATRARSIVGMAAQRVAIVATSVATRTAAIAQRVLNAAMRANPIGLVITAIGLLVAGLVWFFTKTKTGKAVIDALWGGLKTLGGWAKTVGGYIKSFLLDRLSKLVSVAKTAATVISNLPGVGAVTSAVSAVIPGRATGGPVAAGQPYVVGERRPELFVPSTNGTVVPRVPTSADVAGTMTEVADGRPLIVHVQVDRRTIAEATVAGLRVVAARA